MPKHGCRTDTGSVKLSFLGGAGTVTGSKYLLRHAHLDHSGYLPLYTAADAEQALQLLRPVGWAAQFATVLPPGKVLVTHGESVDLVRSSEAAAGRGRAAC